MSGPTRTVVVLSSGGIDSATTCLRLSLARWTVCPLFVDYGQRAARAEWTAARTTARALGTAPARRLRIGGLGSFFPFHLLDAGVAAEEFQELMPHRNLLLATLAAMHASTLGASAIALGTWGDGHSQYPDTTPSFASKLRSLLLYTSGLRLLTPFAGTDKFQIVLYGLEHDLDYSQTWSCNSRDDIHCGQCGSCGERMDFLRDFPEVPPTRYATDVGETPGRRVAAARRAPVRTGRSG
jgi:7-cyano-7-deazaguanine synthase